MNKDKLDTILAQHAAWLGTNGKDGKRADLSGADLSCAILSGADLSCAILSGAILSGADLSCAILSGADLSGANLSGANLSGANLSGAILPRADLSGADLSRADLSCAILSRADLSGALLPHFSIVPEIGAFTAFKKSASGCIIKLLIPDDAERTSSLVGRKCRANKAKVLSIMDNHTGALEADTSSWDPAFVYTVGETVVPREPFDPDIRVECASGIHFFITRKEAEDY